jgi:hypothetical protein
MRSTILWGVALGLGLMWPAGATAIPDSGPHETVDMWSSTPKPNASSALGYWAGYHAAGDPDADPPPLRRLTIQLPAGTRIDTSVPPRCTASDLELRLAGESACPPSAWLGRGAATIRQPGLGVATYDTVLYNAEDQLLELVKSGDQVVGVVHTYVHGTTLDGPIPTCLTGGQPPDGCPFDQFTLLANHLQVNAMSVGTGITRRNYGTTPATCPPTHTWQVRVTFSFADGSVDSVTPRAPCIPAPSPVKLRRRTICARLRTPARRRACRSRRHRTVHRR